MRQGKSDNKVSAIIAAGGASTRMGVNKLFVRLGQETVIEHTVKTFCQSDEIAEIVVCSRQEDISEIERLVAPLADKKTIKVTKGGESRQQSVYAGVLACDKEAELICIHDGARPLVSQQVISDAIKKARQYGAATAAVPVKDTIKRHEGETITETLERSELLQIQTPQVFDKALYLDAYGKAEKQFTDDCQLFESAGLPVAVSTGDYRNIKLTTADDILAAKAFLKKEDNTVRIGHGYDVHRLVEDRKLILGGVDISCEKGLLGHSDADVLLHSIMDALLGAAALGDIGKLFPDSDEIYKGADSLILLGKVYEELKQRGLSVQNIDATVIAQAPKLSPYIDTMRKNIAKTCHTAVENISVKATTEEHLGFTGSGEGIAAHAVCLIC